MDVETVASEPAYGFTERFAGASFVETRERVIDALKAQGFGVLTEIDVSATLKKKLDVEFRPYAILGACNPELAHQALELELGIGLLLPCNVCIWQDGGDAVVSIADPRAMFQVVDNPRLQPIVDEATRRLRAALTALKAH
ncbi:MAG: DUF302 domain-containing protein [Myxococcales bacterium]|nr:DUF302 domain-containing protein [Myxococcales bacterium]